MQSTHIGFCTLLADRHIDGHDLSITPLYNIKVNGMPICSVLRLRSARVMIKRRLSVHVVSDWMAAGWSSESDFCQKWQIADDSCNYHIFVVFEVINLTINAIFSVHIHCIYHALFSVKSSDTWRSCLKLKIWLWLQFLVMHCIYHTYLSVVKSYYTWRSCLKSWIWFMNALLSDSLYLSHLFECWSHVVLLYI